LLSVNVLSILISTTFLFIIAFILFYVSYQELYQIMSIHIKVIGYVLKCRNLHLGSK